MTRNLPTIHDTGDILFYQTEDGETRVQVRFEKESVWLSLNQIADLFQRDKSVISRHISNVFEEGELLPEATVANHATVQMEAHANAEYDTYKQQLINEKSPVEKHFEQSLKQLEKAEAKVIKAKPRKKKGDA